MIGLALEGGGAKGAFHMGAIKAFIEEGYKFHGVVGTSIGAINGAVIAQGDFEKGYNWWTKIDISTIFNLEKIHMQKFMNRNIDKETLIYILSAMKNIIENRGIDTKKMREILNNIIDEDKLRKSKIDFGMVTVSISDFKPLNLYKEDIPNGKMINYLMASANFPIFRIEPLDDRYYIDGGFYDNCPINLLVKKKYTEIIAIRTLGIGPVQKVRNKNVKIVNIIPSESLGRVLNFDNDLIQTNLKMGYCDAMRFIKKLKGRKYYIESIYTEKTFFYKLSSMSKDTIDNLGIIMKLPSMDPLKLLFEKILPDISKIINIQASASYEDIVIGILEYMAEKRQIERYKVYTLDDFIEVIKNVNLQKVSDSNKLTLDIIKKIRLTSTTYPKEIILEEIGNELLGVFE